MSIGEETSVPQNLQIHCHECKKLMPVAFEDLRDNSLINCPRCDYSFAPSIDVEVLLNLIKEAEDSRLDSHLIM